MTGTARHASPHHRWLRRGLVTLAVVALVLVAAWSAFVWWAQPGEPSSFYTPPSPLPGGRAGTIVRDETIDDAGDGLRAWRILYTSTDPSGAPTAVSGVVVAPDGAPPAGGWPVVAWAHGTTGVDRRCAPSTDYADGVFDRVPELESLVNAGTVVAITDYPGLGTPGPHPYLVGQSEGRAVLDSIRAARSLLGDAAVSATVAIYGHSQGGHATLWADQLFPTYAPELRVAGVAPMAPPTDLGVLLDDDVREAAGIVLAALAISSWSAYYPDTAVDAIVDPLARPFVADIGDECIATTDEGLTVVPDVAALEVGFLSNDPATAPGWSDRLRQNAPGDVPTSVPVLVSQGLTDTLVRPEVTRQYVQDQCSAGASIQLDRYPDTDHFAVRTAAAPAVREWLLARLRDEPVASGCTTTEQPAPPTGDG